MQLRFLATRECKFWCLRHGQPAVLSGELLAQVLILLLQLLDPLCYGSHGLLNLLCGESWHDVLRTVPVEGLDVDVEGLDVDDVYALGLQERWNLLNPCRRCCLARYSYLVGDCRTGHLARR